MSKRLVDVLKKIPQWEGIRYTAEFNCPYCDKSGFFDMYSDKKERPTLVGWCETNIGYMVVFECPCCFKRYRFHGTIGTCTADIEEFDRYMYYHARNSKNWNEIKQLLK